ncbi:nitroreductase/quinone reductase family protein [Mycobacterium sp.]|uniref:nitroreductase/quinone reductase family protein n=1 Tax=Mycobacterium sp. TaxID=1785 RepID=UPI003F9A6023
MASWIEERVVPRLLRAHDAVYRNTNGWIGHRTLGMPCLLLHTVGAKTGQAVTPKRFGPTLISTFGFFRRL